MTFNFIDGPASYDTKNVFFVRLDPMLTTTDDLLKSLYYLLWLPGYFGFNWNALNDCLCDLEWIAEEKVVIVHDSVPNIPEKDLKIYLEVLMDAACSWKNGEQHQLEIVFQKRDKEVIEKLLP